MAFTKLDARPARRWALVGFPNDGKSSFAAQMIGPILPVDVDNRFSEVSHLATAGVLSLSEEKADNNDVQVIDRLLHKQMRGSGVKTIVVDSVTPIYQRVTRRHMVNEHEGEVKGNKSAVHREKADVMALLAAAVSSHGTDTLWIWHLNETVFNGGKRVSHSISEIERDRLRKCLNAELEIVVGKDGRRGILIAWARSGMGQGVTLWDTQENFDAGFFWRGMPERIDAALAGVAAQKAPLTAAAASPASASAPSAPASAAAPLVRTFKNPADAIAWGVRELQVPDAEAAQAYASVKALSKPANSTAMWAAWVTYVEGRQSEVAAGAAGKHF